MKFERWVSPWSRTWEYRIFKAHHTELNDMWWSHTVGSKGASKFASSFGASAPTHQAFAAAKHTIRGSLPLMDWYNHYKSFDNWVNLSCALSLCAYFEIYLSRTVAMALRSDPGVLLSSSRSVDGVKLLKNDSHPDLSEQVTSVIKGTWQNRVAAYSKLFGAAPQNFVSQVGELDNLRRLRNSVGHSFGRLSAEDLKFSPYGIDPLKKGKFPEDFLSKKHQPSSFQQLSAERLKKWLGIVENAVNAIEEHLRNQHIGAYEVFQAYHHWDKSHNIGNQSPHGALKGLFEFGPTSGYFKQAIIYYRKS